MRARLKARPTAFTESRGLRPRPGALPGLPSPWAAHRFLQRPMAKRLTDCFLAISSWESPCAKPKMIRARTTSRWRLVLAFAMRSSRAILHGRFW